MIQEYRSVVIDSRRYIPEMRRRQFGPRQGFEILNIQDLIGSDRRLIEVRFCNALTQAKPRHTEQCRGSRQAMEKPATRSRGRIFITHRSAL